LYQVISDKRFDQLKAGEISLIETTPEEAETAKAQLKTQYLPFFR